jgi:hypothetical protein
MEEGKASALIMVYDMNGEAPVYRVIVTFKKRRREVVLPEGADLDEARTMIFKIFKDIETSSEAAADLRRFGIEDRKAEISSEKSARAVRYAGPLFWDEEPEERVIKKMIPR